MLFSENDSLSLFRLEKFMKLSALTADSKKVSVLRGSAEISGTAEAPADNQEGGLNIRMRQLADTESFRRLVFDII